LLPVNNGGLDAATAATQSTPVELVSAAGHPLQLHNQHQLLTAAGAQAGRAATATAVAPAAFCAFCHSLNLELLQSQNFYQDLLLLFEAGHTLFSPNASTVPTQSCD